MFGVTPKNGLPLVCVWHMKDAKLRTATDVEACSFDVNSQNDGSKRARVEDGFENMCTITGCGEPLKRIFLFRHVECARLGLVTAARLCSGLACVQQGATKQVGEAQAAEERRKRSRSRRR